jgi:hypothetical protein
MVLPFGDWRIPALHVLQRGVRFYEGKKKLIEDGEWRMEDGGLRMGGAQEPAK